MTHERFNRTVWAFRSDFTSALAKWLVKQSPYVVPDNLSVCIQKFDDVVGVSFEFDQNEMTKLPLLTLKKRIHTLLKKVPEIKALNQAKNGGDDMLFVTRDSNIHPDDDFIALCALAGNIVCEFAEREDAQQWLDRRRSDKKKRRNLLNSKGSVD